MYLIAIRKLQQGKEYNGRPIVTSSSRKYCTHVSQYNITGKIYVTVTGFQVFNITNTGSQITKAMVHYNTCISKTKT